MKIYITLFAFLGLITSPKAQVIPSDSLALVAIYQATSGGQWTNNTNWLKGPVSSWYGVTILNKRVYQLILWDNGLSGFIPNEIGNLTEMVELIIGQSNLYGPIPNSIGQLTNLDVLDLRHSGVQGKIPASLSNCNKLRQLYLGENRLEGDVDSSLAGCVKLQLVGLNNNQFSGTFPCIFFNLPDLYAFDISYNLFSGPVPANLNRLTQVANMAFSYNQLEGSMPKLDSLVNLEAITLENNKLTGNLENILGYYPKLTYFIANDNAFAGFLSPNHFNPMTVVRLDFFNNRITGLGSFADWGAKSNFTVLNITDNNLDFDDLVPNASLPTHKMWWFPQQNIGMDTTIKLQAGSRHVISSSMKDQDVRYTWSFNGSNISGLTGPEYTIPSLNQGNAGKYQFIATHPKFPDGHLFSAFHTVSLQTSSNRDLDPALYSISYIGAKDEIQIILQPFFSNLLIRVFNTNGQVIMYKNTSEENATISMVGRPAGIYFVELMTEKGRAVTPIFKK